MIYLENNEHIPSFLDISKSNHRHVYNCLMNIISCVDKSRVNRILSHRTIDSMNQVISLEFDDIINSGGSILAVDIKLYVLDLINSWVDSDMKREDFESCANMVKISNEIWKI